MPNAAMIPGFKVWAIMRSPVDGGYIVQEVDPTEECNDTKYRVVAIHPNRKSAQDGLRRMQQARELVEPRWQASIAHEIELRNKYLAFIEDVARPRAEQDDPAGPGRIPDDKENPDA